MKTKIVAACIAAALIITFISCNWFRSKRRPEAFNIHGEWVIDSIENKGSDSSNNTGILVLTLATKDSLPVGIRFNNDSTFQYAHVTDSAKGQYYLSPDEQSLFLKEDSVTHQFNFIGKSDTAVSFASTDSTYYYLRRK
jgi:hypothetical protein